MAVPVSQLSPLGIVYDCLMLAPACDSRQHRARAAKPCSRLFVPTACAAWTDWREWEGSFGRNRINLQVV